MGIRKYEDLCGAARAMDTVGERWSLLVVRELLHGAKRFGDLSAGLPRASQNVLSQRLKELASAGVIQRVKAGPPVSAYVYELTSAGRQLEPALLALARWGVAMPAAPNATMSADAVALGLKELFEPSPTNRSTLACLRLGDVSLRVQIHDAAIEVTHGDAAGADLVVTGTAVDVWNVITGVQTLSGAVAKGRVGISGDALDADRFFGLFATRRAPRQDDAPGPKWLGEFDIAEFDRHRRA